MIDQSLIDLIRPSLQGYADGQTDGGQEARAALRLIDKHEEELKRGEIPAKPRHEGPCIGYRLNSEGKYICEKCSASEQPDDWFQAFQKWWAYYKGPVGVAEGFKAGWNVKPTVPVSVDDLALLLINRCRRACNEEPTTLEHMKSHQEYRNQLADYRADVKAVLDAAGVKYVE